MPNTGVKKRLFAMPSKQLVIQRLVRHLIAQDARSIPPEYDVYMVADALKELLSRLPENLLTNSLASAFIDAAGMTLCCATRTKLMPKSLL